MEIRRRTRAELDDALGRIRLSPRDSGRVDLIVVRPERDERMVLPMGQLDPAEGLVGDDWIRRPASRRADRSPHPGMQLTLMNSRAIEAIAGAGRDDWAWAGDQLYVDFDLGEHSLQPGNQLLLGPQARLEITDQPHNGCAKFSARFGAEALKWVNSSEGKALRLRGIYARVLQGGTVRVGDELRRIGD